MVLQSQGLNTALHIPFPLPFLPGRTASASGFWKAEEIGPVQFGPRAFSYSSLVVTSAAVHLRQRQMKVAFEYRTLPAIMTAL